MKLFYSPILVLAAALVAVKAEKNEEEKMADEIWDILCKQEVVHPAADTAWYSCITCCQDMEPYYTRYSPSALTRDLVYPTKKNANDVGLPFGPEINKALCANPTEYGTIFKNVVVDVKGSLKPEFSTADKMKVFYDKKLECFKACEEEPPRSNCPGFTPDLSAPGPPDALTYYSLYKKYGSSTAVADALKVPCDQLPVTDQGNCRKKYTKYGFS
ncbi:hypothetical protein EC968_006333 [Mortierella alpina]|nr:hypothetical protein EC968_006333 [Mortierella alpina]